MKRLSSWQNIILWLAIIVGALLVLLPIVALVGFGVLTVRPYRYKDTSKSPEGDYTVSVWRSAGQWPFGSARAKVVARGGGERETYETEIADDGGSGGAVVHWLDDHTAQVVLFGSEQMEESVTVDFSGSGIDLTAKRNPYPQDVPEDMKRSETLYTMEWVAPRDGEHLFWVGLRAWENADTGVTVTIYDLYREEVVQTFEDPGLALGSVGSSGTRDADFDGYADFYYKSGNQYFYYIWDARRECYVPDPYGLNEISGLSFNEEEKTVSGYLEDGSAARYRYQDGTLVQIGIQTKGKD